jgi:hypothetical protein
MTTKNLSRTVIEGGRTGYYKAEVAARTSEERQALRAFLHSARFDPDAALETPAPVRRPAMVDFADKLGPMYRFLDARVGYAWDAVRSEIFTKFDPRSAPGRHVIFDHLLRSVCEDAGAPEDAPERRYAHYFVDAQGALRKNKYDPWFGTYRHAPCDLRPAAAMLGSRAIGRRGSRLFWFDASRGESIVATVESLTLVFAYADESGRPLRRIDPPATYPPALGRVYGAAGPRSTLLVARNVRFRQASALSADEEARFSTLPAYAKDKVLALAPTR